MPLTTAEITALWERRKAGESTTALCTETGVCRAQLLRYWRDRGYSPASLPSSNRANAEKLRWNRKAYALHYGERRTWEQVAEVMGWQGSIKALVSRIQHYAQTQDLPVAWKGAGRASQAQRVAKRRGVRPQIPEVKL